MPVSSFLCFAFTSAGSLVVTEALVALEIRHTVADQMILLFLCPGNASRAAATS